MTRAVTHCSANALRQKELQKIIQIAKNHGYSKNLIRKLYGEITTNKMTTLEEQQETVAKEPPPQNELLMITK